MGRVSGFLLPIGVSLVILVYTTLAVLTFTTARADHSFAERNIVFNQAYYEAQGAFEELYGLLDNILLDLEGQDIESQRLALDEALKSLLHQEANLNLLEEQEMGYRLEYEAEITGNTAYYVDFNLSLGDNISINQRGVADISQWDEEYYEIWDG